MAKRYDVTVAGYLGVDLTPGFRRGSSAGSLAELLRPGKLVEVDGLAMSLGGAVGNVGLALKTLGQRVCLQGLVGMDELGDVVLGMLERHGLASGIRRTAEAGTAYGLVLAPPGRDRVFLESPGCNRTFTSAALDEPSIAASRLFHFGYPTLMDAFFGCTFEAFGYHTS